MVCYQQIAYEDDTKETKPDHSKPINMQQKQQQQDGNGEVTKTIEKETPEVGGFYIDDDEPKDEATRKSHRATDWQNVALIWDKFMMIVMTLMTCGSLVFVFFLYVAEVDQSNMDFELNEGAAVESEVSPEKI